jgi:hypothetical protein
MPKNRAAGNPVPLCRHCAERPGTHPRGLCRRCHKTPDVRAQYAPVKVCGSFYTDTFAPAPLPRKPTTARPGTEAKIRVLAARARRRERLFHHITFQLAEVAVPRQVFAGILERIGRLRLAEASG